MDKNLKKVEYFPIKDMMNICAQHIRVFRERVTKKGYDYKGQRLPQYSEGYRDALKRDMRSKKTNKRHKGLEGLSLTTSGQKIGRRLFNLRGITMSGLSKRKVASDHYIIGWDGEPASIVGWNAEKGRNIIDDIPPKEYDFIIGLMSKSIDGQWAKVKNKTIKVG